MNVAQRFGANLARLRKRAGLSQEEVGHRASVHRTEVSQLERGLRVPRIDTVAKLAGALEVEPGALFEGIAWEPGDVRYGRFRLGDATPPRSAVSEQRPQKGNKLPYPNG